MQWHIPIDRDLVELTHLMAAELFYAKEAIWIVNEWEPAHRACRCTVLRNMLPGTYVDENGCSITIEGNWKPGSNATFFHDELVTPMDADFFIGDVCIDRTWREYP